MKSKIINLIILIFSVSILSCKVKHRDTEVNFIIHILPEKYLSTDYCIDEIHAVGRPELSDKCIDSLNNNISLPLNIGADSTIYAFREGNRKDTLILHYQLEAQDLDKEYELVVKKVQLGKCTFGKVEVHFKNGTSDVELNNIERDSDEIESISIYY